MGAFITASLSFSSTCLKFLPDKQIAGMKQQENFLAKQLNDNMRHYLKSKRSDFSKVVQQLDDYSPLKTLERGFVYTTNEDGETISSVDQIKKDDHLNLHFKDGQVTATVTEVRK